MFSTVNENKLDYLSINNTDYITNNNTLKDGILIKSQSEITATQQQIERISINSSNNKILYTNTTNHEAIVNITLNVIYDIVRVVKNSGFVVGDRFVTLNPLVNKITFTGTFKIQPQESLTWSMIHYNKSNSNNTDSVDNPLYLFGRINAITFVDL